MAFGTSGGPVGFGSAAFRVQGSSLAVASYPSESGDAAVTTTNLSHGFPLQRLPFAIQELLGMRSGHQQHQSLALPCSCPVDGPSSLQTPPGCFSAGSVPTQAGPGSSPLEHRQHDAFAQHFHYSRLLHQSSPAVSPGANYLAGRMHDPWRSNDRGIEEGIRRVAAGADMTMTMTTTCQGGNVMTDPNGSYGYGSSQQKTTSSLQGFRPGQQSAAIYDQNSCSGSLKLFVCCRVARMLL